VIHMGKGGEGLSSLPCCVVSSTTSSNTAPPTPPPSRPLSRPLDRYYLVFKASHFTTFHDKSTGVASFVDSIYAKIQLATSSRVTVEAVNLPFAMRGKRSNHESSDAINIGIIASTLAVMLIYIIIQVIHFHPCMTDNLHKKDVALVSAANHSPEPELDDTKDLPVVTTPRNFSVKRLAQNKATEDRAPNHSPEGEPQGDGFNMGIIHLMKGDNQTELVV